MREGCGLYLRVFHSTTLPPAACGLLLYNSYSSRTSRLLDMWQYLGILTA